MKAKLYRFETLNQNLTDGNNTTGSDDGRYNAILEELAVLRTHICPKDLQIETGMPTSLSSNLTDALKLKTELDQIYQAIAHTKREIASISNLGMSQNAQPVDELDAVIEGTETATNRILSAIELVEGEADTLANTLSGDAELSASNIQEQVVSIYEACNFQDITGQRITKVVSVLKFISERTDRMIEIWGGIEGFDKIEVEEAKMHQGDESLLNGPALATDEKVASQDDIDALFA